MNSAKYIFIGLIFLLITLTGILFLSGNDNSDSAPNLEFYCAAAMKLPVEAVVEDYENEFGVKVNVNYGGSGSLLSNIEVSQKGDLYLAADNSYIEIAKDKGLVVTEMPVNQLKAGIAVPKENPYKIHDLKDLLESPLLRIGLANPDAASIGKFTKEILSSHNYWDGMAKSVSENGVFTGTVMELANNLKLNAIDVAIVWDAVVAQYGELKFIQLEEFKDLPQVTTIALLKTSKKSEQALKFMEYLSSYDKGLAHFRRLGYTMLTDGQSENKGSQNE